MTSNGHWTRGVKTFSSPLDSSQSLFSAWRRTAVLPIVFRKYSNLEHARQAIISSMTHVNANRF